MCGLPTEDLGLSRLGVVGLAGRFKNTQVYDAAELYAPEMTTTVMRKTTMNPSERRSLQSIRAVPFTKEGAYSSLAATGSAE